jgi:Ca2+-binding RTX toxin-like protein
MRYACPTSLLDEVEDPMRLPVVLAAVALVAMPAGVANAQTAPICFDKTVTILGTEEKDQLFGTPGHDVISALGADDLVRGFEQGGDDLKDWICGGTESDRIFGDDGNDWIDGERGYDTINGDNGQDRLFGGGGNDTIHPNWGSDFVDGGPGADIVSNGQDRSPRWTTDTLHGGEAGDSVGSVAEGVGSDALYGDAGNDKVDGTDWINEASSTPDLVDGGPGNDRCWADPDDTVVDCEDVTVVN